MAVAIWMIRRTEYFGGRVGAIRADPELADLLVKRGDAQLITRGVKLQKLDRSTPAPAPQPDDEKVTNGGKKGRKAKAPPADDTTNSDVAGETEAPAQDPASAEDPAPADDD